MNARRMRGCLLALLVLVSCDGDDEAQPRPATSQMTPTTTATTTTGTGGATTTISFSRAVDPNRGFSTERVIVHGPEPDDPRASSLFKQVRFSAGDGYDRAVFEFEGFPWGGFYVEYASEADGLGDAGCSAPERVEGADLVISFHGTGTTAGPNPNQGPRSYTGAKRIRPESTTEILEAAFFCELEATVEWVIVVHDQRRFPVAALADPPRLILDVERGR